MREIKFFNIKENKTKIIHVSATTWGELHDALEAGAYESVKDVIPYDMTLYTAKVKELAMSFDNSKKGREKELPLSLGEGFDFTLYLVSQKIKSGNAVIDKMSIIQERMTELDALLEELKQQIANEHSELSSEVYRGLEVEVVPEDISDFI